MDKVFSLIALKDTIDKWQKCEGENLIKEDIFGAIKKNGNGGL